MSKQFFEDYIEFPGAGFDAIAISVRENVDAKKSETKCDKNV